jgi:hypothetical protein
MTTWRLDIDEDAIYCGDKRVATLDTDLSNEGWREALRVGQDMVDAMNGTDRESFEARMRAAGHNPAALSRLSDGSYLSPTVHSEWRSACDAASYRGKELESLRKDAEKAQREAMEWRQNFDALQTALVGKTGASGIQVAHALRKDAERYRFLRAVDHIPISPQAARDPVAYDAAIDAAMAKEKR